MPSREEETQGVEDRHGSENRDEEPDVSAPRHVKSNIPPTDCDQCCAYKEREYRLNVKRYRVEWVTLLLVIATVYSLGVWRKRVKIKRRVANEPPRRRRAPRKPMPSRCARSKRRGREPHDRER